MPRLLAACAVMLTIAGSGCTTLRHMAALDPYAGAPATAAAPWAPSQPMAAERPAPGAWRLDPAVLPDQGTTYDLAGLVDVALRANPETRRAWEQARAAAAGLGGAESAYFPTVWASVPGGYTRTQVPSPRGNETVRSAFVVPQLDLTWVLLDFGRRSADVERAYQQLLEANFTFNRRLQEVVHRVQLSFYSLDASRAQVTAALATLHAARTVEAAVEARQAHGLATQPELLLARQETARASLQVEAARGEVMDAEAALAESVGVPPTVPLRITDLSAQPLPPDLPEAVEAVIDTAIKQRPDLAARLAALRAREAEERSAHAAFLPEIWLSGNVSQSIQRYHAEPPPGTFDQNTTLYGALLQLQWTLFDGFERQNTLRAAESERAAAEAALAATELRAIREVWRAYADVKTAQRKYEFAVALLAASEAAYASNLESYRLGLGTIVELLAAQRDLASARTTVIASKAELLTASATLAFAAGELPREP